LIRFALVDVSKPDDTIFDKDCDRFGLCITKRETPWFTWPACCSIGLSSSPSCGLLHSSPVLFRSSTTQPWRTRKGPRPQLIDCARSSRISRIRMPLGDDGI